MANPLNKPNDSRLKVFSNTNPKERVFLTSPDLAEKTRLTVASKRGRFNKNPSNVPPNGRQMTSGKPSATETTNLWSQEDGRSSTSQRTHGKVINASNHPNTKINKYYGQK